MMTAEALIRPHSFDHNISTLMGIVFEVDCDWCGDNTSCKYFSFHI